MAVNLAGLIGFGLGLVMTVLGIINSGVLYAIVREKMYVRKSPIYLIAASNLFIDNAMLLLHLLYFIPSLMAETFFFKDGLDDYRTILFSSIFMWLWYCTSISQIIMALNRLVVMCFSSYEVFTLKNTKIFVGLVYPISFGLAITSQYILPCCRFSFNYQVFSYMYVQIGNMTNYPNYYIDLPLNSSSSLVCIICYSAIVFWMRNLGSKITLGKSDRRKQKMEVKYAFQFSIISLFYLLTWTGFRIYPLLIGTSNMAYYAFCPLTLTIACGANGLVYISSNSEIKNILLRSHAAVSSTNGPASSKSQHYQTTSHMSQN